MGWRHPTTCSVAIFLMHEKSDRMVRNRTKSANLMLRSFLQERAAADKQVGSRSAALQGLRNAKLLHGLRKAKRELQVGRQKRGSLWYRAASEVYPCASLGGARP